MNDHDLTVMVDAAASGAVDAQAALHGSTPWADLDPMSRIAIKEAALPFVFHGAKALADLGYSKPRTIVTAEELEALPPLSVILDGDQDVWQKRGGSWASNETAWHTSERLQRFAPFTVLLEPVSA